MKFTFGPKTLQLILLSGIAAGAISALFLGLLDTVVHKDLYNYGLHFSYEWANKYWTYMRLAAICVGIFVATNSLAIFYLHRARTRYYPIKTRGELSPRLGLTNIIGLTFLGTGIAALTASLLYSSSTLAFIGLGLAFWGAIFLYIKTGDYIKGALLDRTTFPSLVTLNQMIAELGFKGQAVYLPPKYLEDFESSKIFIPKLEETKLPMPKQIQRKEKRIFMKNPEGILLMPPGADLARLFEETLGTSFTKVDLNYLESNIPRILVEDLEIAQNVEIEAKRNKIYVKMENSIYRGMYTGVEEPSNTRSLIGRPICSAIACAIAKATGKPVIIERDQTNEAGQTISIEYRLL